MVFESKELLINMQSTPDEESQEFFDFWKTEGIKCKNGITIDGVFISGFLYFHLNFFKCQIDVEKNGRIERKFTNPYLRDNEWIIDSYIRQGEQERKGVCILGSRRLAKSVFEASYIVHRSTFFKGTQNVIAGLNEPDIKIIADLAEESLTALPIAFKKGRVEDNWKKQVTLGEKSISGERSIWSSIPIRNLDGGKNTEALAGLSPFSMVIDEIGKGDWLQCFSAAIPGFATPFGWRCSPLAFGTSGDMEKAKDAQKVFDSPGAYNFIAVELKDEPQLKKSIFIPGHYAHDFPKDEKKLTEYLDLDTKAHPNLSKIKIQVTNFERAEEMINKEREQASESNDLSALLKITMYHPKNRHELFLTDSNNNFPIHAITAHQEYLKNNYELNNVIIERDINKKLKILPCNIDIIREFPVKATSIKDAPYVIYEDVIPGLPEFTYIAGIDAYNENESSDKVNSLGVIYIYKRMHDPTKPFQNSIVASYAGRPKSVREFIEICLNLMEYYGAVALIERNKTFIESFYYKKKDHLLVDGLPIAKAIKSNTLTGAEKGLPPTTPNQEFYMNKMVEYTKEDLMIEEGRESMGCSRIPDIMLLEEMKQYRSKPSSSKGIHDGNFDRIVAFGHVLTLAAMLDRDNVDGLEIQPISNVENGWNFSKKVLGSIIVPNIKSPFSGQSIKRSNRLPF